ncbi:MAG: hypothetical protein ABFD76_05125 [Smithella sp.]
MTKIESLGLQNEIEKLIESGTTTSSGIFTALSAQGFKISQPTVYRYLKAIKKERQAETASILSDHISKNLPTDLNAIEAMEAQCLEWTKEDNDKFAHRLAVKHVLNDAPQWISIILNLNDADPKVKNQAVKDIMKKCLRYFADDFKLQSYRLAAMKQATSIIDMKLRYAMGESQDGKIIFLNNGEKVERDKDTGKLVVIPGGQN